MGKNKKRKRGVDETGNTPDAVVSLSEHAKPDSDSVDGVDRSGLSRAARRNLHKKNKQKEKLAAKRAAAASGTFDNAAVIIGEGTQACANGAASGDTDVGKKVKKEKEKEKEREKGKNEDETEEIKQVIEYPYEVDGDDHCETPAVAYEDLSLTLDQVVSRLGKTRATLRIYDPYFCEGGMKARLQGLGFTCVHNKCEDFYANISKDTVPEYDVLVTNPPYSGDHVPKLLRFCAGSKKPFFLLMPNYFHTKDYYEACLRRPVTGVQLSLFFVSSGTRYAYHTPKGRRQQKSAKYTAPFPSYWYCHLGFEAPVSTIPSAELQACYNHHVAPQLKERAVVFSADASTLPLCVLDERDPRKKKEKNDRKREKHKARKLQRVAKP